jgi:hypothetical protein
MGGGVEGWLVKCYTFLFNVVVGGVGEDGVGNCVITWACNLS